MKLINYYNGENIENTHVETYVVNAEGIEEESRFELYDKSSVGSSNSKL